MSPDPTESERELWRAARDLDQLGALTARFLEGELGFFPGWLASDVDEETDEILDALVAFNRGGFVTLASQPGRGPHTGFGGHVFAQRAFVAGFVTPAAAEAIGALALDTELIVSCAPATDTGGCRIPVARRGSETTAWAGHAAGPEELEIFAETLAPEAWNALARARYLSVIDPRWEQRELLWDSIRAALRNGPHGDPPAT